MDFFFHNGPRLISLLDSNGNNYRDFTPGPRT
jgi:hypothetical protein